MAAETKEAAAMAEASSEAAAATALSELTALLSPSSPAAPEAAEAALALSGSASGRALLASNPAALSALAAMAASASRGAHTALAALVNASAEPAALEPLLAALPPLLPLVPSSGAVCGLLANLSREPEAAPRVLRALGPGAEPLLRALSGARPPAELGALLCNLSQAPEGRRVLLDRSRPLVPRLLPLIRSPDSAELRRGVVGALRNCCFEHDCHAWLLSPALEALPALLLPLAGPEELPPHETEPLGHRRRAAAAALPRLLRAAAGAPRVGEAPGGAPRLPPAHPGADWGRARGGHGEPAGGEGSRGAGAEPEGG
ncbi:protein HGH1 homolog isoform X3 [Corvus moneduloides]|uniref:protein HGH1 homolog isoform X3 n=1 Tax=Corvus moneduloides TaxID=1196302 RepID=UPI001361F76A|nr:protein HGH1 homolog isoform X3 [Corvus moneduloides]